LISKGFTYCGDHITDYNVVYIQGTGGALADMDIDCDGRQNSPYSNHKCDSSDDTIPETAFKEQVAGYKKGLTDLDSYIHTYVVFGNYGKKSGYVNFHPTDYGIEPLSLMAVVCNNKLVGEPYADI
jgi:hypothetical protein